MSLTASPYYLWPQQHATLTATANANVGPTPYYLRIYDLTAATYVATCGSGTTCSASVTEPVAASHTYVALVSLNSATYPPAGIQAQSNYAYVTWHGVFVTIAAAPTTVPVGAVTTVTATASADIGPSPFYIQIYDVTTGVRLAVCGFGTTCSATVSQAIATTHRFRGYISNYGTPYPPSGIQATSPDAYVTWSPSAFRVSLTAPTHTYGAATATASTNINVGPTPYWIEIFDERTGVMIGKCGFGTTCSATFTPSFAGDTIVAFVSGSSTTLPPALTQASSNIVTTRRLIIF